MSLRKRLLTSTLIFSSLLYFNKVLANDNQLTIQEANSEFLQLQDRFKNSTAKDLELFVSKQAELEKIHTVFYPFGGADIIYPLTIYPNTTKITLIGMEKIGFIPNTKQSQLKPSNNVQSLLRKSFFVTKDMCESKDGILNLLLEQLQLLNVQNVIIENFDKDNRELVIKFHYKGIQRTVYYYKKDMSDPKISLEFFNLLQEKGFIEGVLLKATSYTIHQAEFAQIKKIILDSASVVVQDDSGIPLKDFAEKFEVRKYGQYTKPYGKEFTGYYQKLLKAKEAENDETLPFCFGYGCKRQAAHIMIAIKKPND
ncbi:MAG: hypothetical protein RCG15_02185 [Candidatus Rickettsia vulgarisii]